MGNQVLAENLVNDLEKAQKLRHQFANYLSKIASTLSQAELEAEHGSGKLELERDIADLEQASRNLQSGVFRLLVLGDMKRGKSTFLNALMGERVLPADVNPCTAVLTVLRYGQQKKVTVHFNSGKSPETLDFDSFKRRYTIDPEEAKKLQSEKKQAFPDVDYAVVEYPLEMLEKGVEIIDSPGLNDTEARNNLTLGYITNCHAILFVLSATQQCTLGERRYLENYIKNRGQTVFFLANQWDRVRESLVDPDDIEELKEAEAKVAQVFKSNLFEYCQVEGQDLYERRFFKVSSLPALRSRLKQPPASLQGTGFSEFMEALNIFLTQERTIAELRQARTLARQTYVRVKEVVERRLPLLDNNVEELRQKIKSVQPEFNSLVQIRERFKDEVQARRDEYADKLANSFEDYVSNLSTTFEADFFRYQPEIKMFEFLRHDKRKEFEAALEQAFAQYLNDKMSAWGRDAEGEMNQAFAKLVISAAHYGAAYSKITDRINEKIAGKSINHNSKFTTEDNSPAWARWAAGATALLTGDFVGAAMAGSGAFDWKSIMLNMSAIIGTNLVLYLGFGVVLGPLGVILPALGAGAFSLSQARKKLVETTKQEMMKVLPQVAKERAWDVYNTVKDTFNAYGKEVIQRMNDDINARKAELDNLLQQKESGEINRDTEIKRLKTLESNIFSQWNTVEATYDDLVVAK